MQQFAVFAIGGLTVAYLLWRYLRRRASCACGEKECPAANQMVDKFQRS